MALPLANNFDGGTATAAITALNSGGISGTAFEAFGANAPTFDSVHSHGGLACKILFGTNFVSYVSWTTQIGTLSSGTLYLRMYLYFTAFPSASVRIFEARNATGLHVAGQVNITTGFIRLISGSTGTTVATGATPIAVNQWIRVEASIPVGASVTPHMLLFNSAEGATPEDISGAITNGQTSITIARFGYDAATTIAASFWIDDIALNTTGLPGPSLVPRPSFASFQDPALL